MCIRRRLALAAGASFLAFSTTAFAGPPFLCDDPEPVEYRHWEAYLFGTVDRTTRGTQTQGPAVEVNYGAAPDLQAHVIFPWAATFPDDGRSASGIGDSEIGLKYRFVHETDRVPQIGLFPMLEVPTGDADRGLGVGRVWARLPVWAQKSWGAWTTYGGGGLAVNTGPGQRNYPFAGWLLQSDLGGGLVLGGELYAQGKTQDGGQATLFANLGGYYNFSEHFSLLFSVGHSLAGEDHLIGYFALYWTW